MSSSEQARPPAGGQSPVDQERASVADAPRSGKESARRDSGRRAVVSSRSGIAEQRRRFGGLKWGAAFFGWLVATGLAVIATAMASAAGVALAVNTLSKAGAKGNAATIGIAGGALLILILLVSYYAGGYVAGRLARFDGGVQGVGVWVIGVVVTVAFAVAGAVAGSQYNVLSRLNLPNLPVGKGTATTGGMIAFVIAVIATLVAAIVGGKVGERYHRKIDGAGIQPVNPTDMAY